MLLPGKADLVIIGGGIFGCAIAYYYTRDNPGKKVVVIERNELCNAATSRAAALVTKIRSKEAFIPLSMETYRVVGEMESILEESLDMKRVGVMHVAATENSVNSLNELMAIAGKYGQPATYITNEEGHERAPWLDTEKVLRIGFMPGEAYCDPYLLGTFFARCAKLNGAGFLSGTEVLGLVKSNARAEGVITSKGKIEADAVVIASGAWAPILAAQAGTSLPMAPVRSQYWITEKSDLFPGDSPIVLMPDARAYARPESGSLLFGIREKDSFCTSPVDIPADISHYVFSPDRGVQDLAGVIDRLGVFFPKIADIGLKYYIAGFSGYTPDNNMSMGRAGDLGNVLFATGCAGAGISVSGGVGLAFAEMAAGRPNPFDFSSFDIGRFGNIDPFSKEWLERCAKARSEKTSG
jgi:sarcosine oxidase, subunit beta